MSLPHGPSASIFLKQKELEPKEEWGSVSLTSPLSDVSDYNVRFLWNITRLRLWGGEFPRGLGLFKHLKQSDCFQSLRVTLLNRNRGNADFQSLLSPTDLGVMGYTWWRNQLLPSLLYFLIQGAPRRLRGYAERNWWIKSVLRRRRGRKETLSPRLTRCCHPENQSEGLPGFSVQKLRERGLGWPKKDRQGHHGGSWLCVLHARSRISGGSVESRRNNEERKSL